MRCRGAGRLRATIVVLVATLGLAACGSDTAAPPVASPPVLTVPAAQTPGAERVRLRRRRRCAVPSGECWTSSITVANPSAYRCFAGKADPRPVLRRDARVDERRVLRRSVVGRRSGCTSTACAARSRPAARARIRGRSSCQRRTLRRRDRRRRPDRGPSRCSTGAARAGRPARRTAPAGSWSSTSRPTGAAPSAADRGRCDMAGVVTAGSNLSRWSGDYGVWQPCSQWTSETSGRTYADRATS